MPGTSCSVLGDLLATTETVADNDGLSGFAADGGQKDALAQLLGEFELVLLEAKRTGHTAATRVEKLDLRAGKAKESDLILHAHGGSMMAVSVDDNLLVELWRAVMGSVFDEELAEEEGLVVKFFRARIVRQKVGKLVAKDRGTAWLEDNDGDTGVELQSKGVENFEEIVFRRIEHAKVIEGTSTAEVSSGE